jgi:hypothetical protein
MNSARDARHVVERALSASGPHTAQVRDLGAALRAVVGWLVAIALVVAAFGFTMVVVTRWMFDKITDGSKGFQDSLLRLFAAFIAGPIVGIAAGATCAVAVGVPAFFLLQKVGVVNPLRRKHGLAPPAGPASWPPPPTYYPAPPGYLPPPWYAPPPGNAVPPTSPPPEQPTQAPTEPPRPSPRPRPPT